MKLNKKFLLRQIMDEYVLVPMGKAGERFDGLITTNEIGAFLWDKIPAAADEKALVAAVLEEYETDEATVSADVAEFLGKLRDNEIID